MLGALAKLHGALLGFRFQDGDDADDSTPVTALPGVDDGLLRDTLEGHGYTRVEDVRQASVVELRSLPGITHDMAIALIADATDDPEATIHATAARAARYEVDEPVHFDGDAAVDLEGMR